MSTYQGFCIAEIGTNGTGKSTYMKKFIDRYPKTKDVLLTMDDDSETMWDYLTEIEPEQIPYFKGKAKSFIEYSKKEKNFYLDQIYNGFGKRGNKFNGGLWAVDDAMTVFGTRDENVMKIFKKRRQRKLDIIINCHGASEYPISLFKNTTHFVIFKTVDSYDHITKRMNKEIAQSFINAINYVNKKAEQNQYFNIVFDLKNPPKIPTL
jgi:hypothetical protein